MIHGVAVLEVAVAAVVAAVAVLVVDLADAGWRKLWWWSRSELRQLGRWPRRVRSEWTGAGGGSAQAAERDETPRALDAVAAGQVQRIEARVVSEPVPRAAAQAGGTLEALAQKAQVVIETPRPIAAN